MPPVRDKSGRFAKKSEVVRREKAADQMKTLNARRKKKDDEHLLESVGSRVVDLAVLANHLWCHTCNSPLTLRTLEKEMHRGLASLLRVRCITCLDVVTVPTSKPVLQGSQYPLWSVNLKAAAGMRVTIC